MQRCWCIVAPGGREYPTTAKTRDEAIASPLVVNDKVSWDELHRAGWRAKRRLIVDARALKETVLLRGIAIKIVKYMETVESGGLAFSVLKDAQKLARAWRLKYGLHS